MNLCMYVYAYIQCHSSRGAILGWGSMSRHIVNLNWVLESYRMGTQAAFQRRSVCELGTSTKSISTDRKRNKKPSHHSKSGRLCLVSLIRGEWSIALESESDCTEKWNIIWYIKEAAFHSEWIEGRKKKHREFFNLCYSDPWTNVRAYVAELFK